MKNIPKIISGLVFLSLILMGVPIVAQQEVVLTIREGMPMIPLALPDFIIRSASPQAKAAADEIRKVLEGDLRFSRIFQPLPPAHYA